MLSHIIQRQPTKSRTRVPHILEGESQGWPVAQRDREWVRDGSPADFVEPAGSIKSLLAGRLGFEYSGLLGNAYRQQNLRR